ncbi:MAG: caspase family protein [Bacteroidales bacterium]|nr:caspase family protein [Bacteroidales bacterium]
MRKLVFVCMLLCGPLFGQVVQYGKVVEMDEQGKPIAGATLSIPSEHDCQPTFSDSQGRFRLCFGEHHVGDVIHGIAAKKHGYDVVNVHVTRSWTLTTEDTLRIVMAPKGKLKEARTRYYGLSRIRVLDGFWMMESDRVIEVESPVFSFNIGRYGADVAASDVDIDIPVTKEVNDRTFAVIVANEAYQREQDVTFAIHDGEIFREYCLNTLGIPERNIHMVADATLNNMRFELDWLKGALEAYQGESRGIFYYSGHGIPDETSRNAYLMPVDGYVGNRVSGYAIDTLYAFLGSAGADLMLYFIDACFSGATRDGNMLAETRGVTVNSKAGVLQGNAVALTAAQGNETAQAHQEKSHGLFTYFLLKKLKETQGDMTLGELSDYLNENVSRTSADKGMKLQHPSAESSMEGWKSLKLK